MKIDGPVNACSNNQLKLTEIFDILENILSKKPIIAMETSDENQSPFGVVDSWYMDTRKARNAGFEFKDLDEWFPKLVAELARN